MHRATGNLGGLNINLHYPSLQAKASPKSSSCFLKKELTAIIDLQHNSLMKNTTKKHFELIWSSWNPGRSVRKRSNSEKDTTLE